MISDALRNNLRVRIPAHVFQPISYWASIEPDRTAIISSESRLTYRELELRTNRLARALVDLGVRPGDRVTFVLPRGIQAVTLLISILKGGAAYVPLDAATPPSRIQDCISDAAPTLIVAEPEVARYLEPECPVISMRDLQGLAEVSDHSFERPEIAPDGLAYIIFTSGSTGRPKGVPIRHESLLNFVVGNQHTCIKVEPEDRVLQAFSPASDGHHEEIWPTFLAGATLVVATGKEVYSGLELGNFLREHEVTIISCAPTLLSLLDDDVPSLRRILFGAEHCPSAMVERWWRPAREILNTYGPTEATVGATFGICEPGKPVNIGKPLPGYYCYVVDENLDEQVEGELCIAGIGVSDGYYGRPDLTAAKFVPNPHALPGERNGLLYRTGDLVRRDEEGNLVWLGRIDAQVKIRGHRIEPSEIESHCIAQGGVQSSVVVVRESASGEKHLAALLLLREDDSFDLSSFLERLRSVLPPYMVPAAVEIVDRIPVLPSGKIDRKACEGLQGRSAPMERELVPPRTVTERLLLTIWKGLFNTEDISCTDDFFTELGGYSLLASRFVSILRSEHGYTSASVLDIYENPTIKAFAALLDEHSRTRSDHVEFLSVPPSRYAIAKLLQGFGVLVLFAIQGLFWLGPIVAAVFFSNIGHSEIAALGLALGIHAASVPILLTLSVAVKWIVGGRFKEGDYPIWGGTFLRWWFVHRVLAIAPVTYLTGTPLAGLYLRLLGAKVGRSVSVESLDVDTPDLIEIGDDCSLENSSWLRAAEVRAGVLRMRRVKLASGCVVGVRSGVSGGGVMKEGSVLRDLSVISEGLTIPAHEEWQGTPARKCIDSQLPPYEPSKRPGTFKRFAFGLVQAVLLVILSIMESLPFTAVGFWLYSVSDGMEYALEPLYALALVGYACVQALLVKWLVVGRLKEGTFDQPGWIWLRKWFAEKHLELISGLIVPIYDSLFARPWCRLLGMKCGPRCEIALPRRLPYDLVEMGAESFLASEVSIGMPIRRNGQITLTRTMVGERVFLGNDSVLPQGSRLPNEFLLGVLSSAPSNKVVGPEQSWLGSPAFRMPARQVHDQFSVEQTYRPTRRLYLERLAHEAFRVVLPSAFSLMIAAGFMEAFAEIWNDSSFTVALLSIPLLYIGAALAGAALIKLTKLVLVGHYKKSVQPLWSAFVWKVETYSAVLHDFGVPLFVQPLVGTPYMSAFMRFLGAKVGRRAFLNSTDFTESDLIEIGDDTAINANAPLQCHLFEDRVMKMGPIRIGKRCNVGVYSVVLCESELKDDATIGHLSLVMKGETIPSKTSWAGSPAQING